MERVPGDPPCFAIDRSYRAPPPENCIFTGTGATSEVSVYRPRGRRLDLDQEAALEGLPECPYCQ
jgi:hypothetical protein